MIFGRKSREGEHTIHMDDPKKSSMNYAHVLLDSDDNAVTVFLQQCVTIEETAGSYKMLLETYNKRMHISETFEDSLQNLRQKRQALTIQITNLVNDKKLALLIL